MPERYGFIFHLVTSSLLSVVRTIVMIHNSTNWATYVQFIRMWVVQLHVKTSYPYVMCHYFLRRKLGNFHKNNPAQQNAVKLLWKGSHDEKIKQVHSQLIFNFKKMLLHKLLPTKKIIHNLRVRKKFHALENCPTPKPLKKYLSAHYNAQQRSVNFINATYEVRKHQSFRRKEAMHLQFFIFIGFIPRLAAGKKLLN